MYKKYLYLLLLIIHGTLQADLRVGTGIVEMTPPLGTPSAGYAARKGEGMIGVRDPLLAVSLWIETDSKQIVFCSVDHLGFDSGMVAEVQKRVKREDESCEIFISSSHTHSGGGAFISHGFGEILAGKFSPAAREYSIQKAVEAILCSRQTRQPAKIGIGYGTVKGLSFYRSQCPQEAAIPDALMVLKITHLDDTPMAVLFNYALHPTVLSANNRLFSADFVGDARFYLKQLQPEITALYVNGAQGDLIPVQGSEDEYERCSAIGCKLAQSVLEIWEQTETSEQLTIETIKERYTFDVIATPQGLKPPLEKYPTEINLIVLNGEEAILTIPGELSCHYDVQLKAMGKAMGYHQVSIFGLTNDAHGYIILPESWEYGTSESRLCFGGPFYGERLKEMMLNILARAKAALHEGCDHIGQND